VPILTVPIVRMAIDMTPMSKVQATVGIVLVVDFGSSRMMAED
jgi:hypothetical protein